MTRVFLASSQPETRSAFRLLLLDLEMLVVGEAADWPAALAKASGTHPEMLVVDWNLIPQGATLSDLRATCADEVLIVLISQMDARRQAALSAGADYFISKGEMPDRVTARLRSAAENTKRHATFM